MRTQGGGGQKTVKFCGRPLWMAPKYSEATTLTDLRNNCRLTKPITLRSRNKK